MNEAIEYIFDEYCRETDRKIYAMGFSMGGNWLGMALAKGQISNKIVAAVCMQSPAKMRQSFLNMKAAWNGFINWGLGKGIRLFSTPIWTIFYQSTRSFTTLIYKTYSLT